MPDPTVDPASQFPSPQAGFADSSALPAQPAGNHATASAAEAGDMLDAASIEELLKAANFEDPETVHAAANVGPEPMTPTGDEFRLPNLNQVMQDAAVSSIELLRDVDLNVKIELGRARMLVGRCPEIVRGIGGRTGQARRRPGGRFRQRSTGRTRGSAGVERQFLCPRE
jgi:flagellar motor switch/type III secretory pathway protein FliN